MTSFFPWNIVNTKNEPSSALYQHSSLVIDEQIYIFGGENEKRTWTNSLNIFNINDLKWTIISEWKESQTKPPNVDGHTAVLYNNEMIIYGGSSDSNCSIYSLNIKNNEWKKIEVKKEPKKRTLHSSCLFEDYIYTFGGKSINSLLSQKFLNDFNKFNLKTKEWKEINIKEEGNDLISSRCGHTCNIFQNDKLIIFGGLGENQYYFNDTFIFNLKDQKIKQIKCKGNIPKGRERHTSLMFNENELYIFGGWTKGGPSYELFCLNLNNFEWKQISLASELYLDDDGMRFGSSCFLSQNIFCVFGGKNENWKNYSNIISFNKENKILIENKKKVGITMNDKLQSIEEEVIMNKEILENKELKNDIQVNKINNEQIKGINKRISKSTINEKKKERREKYKLRKKSLEVIPTLSLFEIEKENKILSSPKKNEDIFIENKDNELESIISKLISPRTKKVYSENVMKELKEFSKQKRYTSPPINTTTITTTTLINNDITPLIITISKEREEILYKKRCKIIDEFLETERTYVNDLSVLNIKFIIPLRNILNEEEMIKIFFGLEEIISINNEFLTQLEKISRIEKDKENTKEINLSSLLFEFSNSFLNYSNFIINYKNSIKTVNDLFINNEKFQKYIVNIRMDCLKLTNQRHSNLNSFLITPVQRLPRYRLLLSDLLKNTPKILNENVYEDIKESLDEIHKITLKLNEKQRDLENAERLSQIENEFNLTLKDKKYIKEIETISNRKKCLLILLNDTCLIIKNQTSLFGNVKKDIKQVPLKINTYVVPNSMDKTHCGFTLTNENIKEKFDFGSDDNLSDSWVKSIRDQIDLCTGKKGRITISQEQQLMLNASIPTF
eukprot:gene6062-10063_t